MQARKIIIAVAVLLVCTILLVSVSFAWVALSRAPEATGMETYIGANGSLEMALLTYESYMDPSMIRTGVGDSMELGDFTRSNIAWGNMVDLSHSSYGLDQITVYPARLNAHAGEEGLVYVGSNLLLFPEYSADGRLQTVNPNSVTAVYNGTEFLYSSEVPGYGVRGIGSIPNISLQETALVNARVAVRSYGLSAVSAAKSAWKNNGAAWLELYLRHYVEKNDEYTRADVETVYAVASKLLTAVNYLDLALRQAVIGYAASFLDDTDTFKTVRDTVENTSIPLSMIVSSANIQMPESMDVRVKEIDQYRAELTLIVSQCAHLPGNQFTWDQFGPILDNLLNGDRAYLNDIKITSLTANYVLAEDNRLSVIPGAGPLAAVAEYAGGYNTLFDYSDKSVVEVEVLAEGTEPYLQKLATLLDEVEISENGEQIIETELMDIYGYAVDMGFRCNAEESALLLQATPAERVEPDTGEKTETGTSSSLGGGSFLRFESSEMSRDQLVAMMDAMRVGFIDDQNRLLALAKPGVTNAADIENGLEAPLYLYDFSVSADGLLILGERREDRSEIVELEQSEVTRLTVVVWLDGDSVDNRLAGILQDSLNGSLNLQFASSAALRVAGN